MADPVRRLLQSVGITCCCNEHPSSDGRTEADLSVNANQRDGEYAETEHSINLLQAEKRNIFGCCSRGPCDLTQMFALGADGKMQPGSVPPGKVKPTAVYPYETGLNRTPGTINQNATDSSYSTVPSKAALNPVTPTPEFDDHDPHGHYRPGQRDPSKQAGQIQATASFPTAKPDQEKGHVNAGSYGQNSQNGQNGGQLPVQQPAPGPQTAVAAVAPADSERQQPASGLGAFAHGSIPQHHAAQDARSASAAGAPHGQQPVIVAGQQPANAAPGQQYSGAPAQVHAGAQNTAHRPSDGHSPPPPGHAATATAGAQAEPFGSEDPAEPAHGFGVGGYGHGGGKH